MNSSKLYQEVILDHNKRPRNWGVLDNPTHKAEGVNPLCGDRINLTIKVSDDLIEDIAVKGQSCAICKASASMMTTSVKGKKLSALEQMVSKFRDMVLGKNSEYSSMGSLVIFKGIKDLPSRVKCATLPWHTLTAAFGSRDSVSTEGDFDPILEKE